MSLYLGTTPIADGASTALLSGKADVDLSNMNPTQTVKDTIVGWGMPDYSAGTAPSLVSDTKYTASSNIMINGYCSLTWNATVIIRIYDSNDTTLQELRFTMGNQNEVRNIPFEIVVPKGYKYAFSFGGYAGLTNVKVFPMVGG